ncbi:exocyst complex component 4 isoform X2 [Nematostella vectensis]|uniref:exocyst complex component 4 isoform X2 n=1 Tax=Nematostella vectensis TaxID=45351 RepID=UPI00138F9DD5|nr:exocyst complex component 4 isoform X2 [Nematostella vectensis]
MATPYDRRPHKFYDSSSAVLLSVIRTLATSGNIKQREIEKERLQYEYREVDDELNKLVEKNQEQLKSTIQTFTGISSRIQVSLDKVKHLKESLHACKTLLRCKRDALKKYWMEGMEYNEVLSLLDRIDQVKNVPEEIGKFKQQKYYLHATELLVNTVSLLEGSLSGVEALRHLRLDLQAKKKIEHELLIEELHRQLYIKSCKTSKNHSSAPQKESSGSFKKSHHRSASRSLMLDQANSLSVTTSKSDHELIEDLQTDPEEDSDNFMMLLVESLSLLGKIPEAIEAIKSRMKIEMSLIVHRATSQVIERAGRDGEVIASQNQTHLLLELIELIFDKFRGVAHAHTVVLSAIHKIIGEGKDRAPSDLAETQVYRIDVIWYEIQFALQVLLNDYLDVQDLVTPQQSKATFSESDSDISAFFLPRRRGASRTDSKVHLFRFEGSSSAISMNAYIRERRQECMAGTGNVSMDDGYGEALHNTKPQLLCRPDPRNITVVFCPVMEFVKEIEAVITMEREMHCTLYGFITDYVKEIFIDKIKFEITEKLETLSLTSQKGLDAFKHLADTHTIHSVEAPRPLLQSTVTVYQLLQDLKGLMHSVPQYSSQFLDMVCRTLTSYRDTCNAAYKELLRYTGESDKPTRIISGTWAKDEDISRLLRTLPNWTNLQQPQHHRPRKDDDEDMEAIKIRNARESEILTNNLGEHMLSKAEVLLDHSDLKALANLQESMEWLSNHIRLLATSLSANSTSISIVTADTQERIKTQEIPPVDEDVLKSLGGLAQDFQRLAETCVLVLHLEIRCHCFFFLMPAVRQPSYMCNMDAVDPDPSVIQLNKDLTSLEEIATASLAQHKFRYLFEGLGHLVSSILISNLSFIKKINQNGIKKMCRNIFALQQNLTNITMSREGELDRARQYYELLYHNPDEILTVVVEQGAKYSETEYIALLQLKARSQTVRDNTAHERQLQRLKEILREPCNGTE